MSNDKKTIFITGGAGYVGAMLCDQFSKRDDVKEIVALDMEPIPDLLKENKKIIWIEANTSDGTWQKKAKEHKPSIVIHAAWQIREMYGNSKTQWTWNVDGADAVFDFAFSTSSTERLIYFSTASLYGAYKSNTIDHLFTEDEPMREEEYSYGIEKIQVERNLCSKWEKRHKENNISVSIVRPAAITGPRGRFMMHDRFGLQSALSGQLKKDFIYRIISMMVSFVPATPWWVRQFVHEDDITDIIALLAFSSEIKNNYEIFNLATGGEPVFAPQMAQAVGKKVLPVRPWMVRLAYFFFWHITRGKVPTSKGIWRFYSYPIVMDGSKLTKKFGYHYTYESRDAFSKTIGRYERYVPEDKRVS
ncbi:NAD-dependent epimerase/dehydratase family protein [Patescibacteria group bacterium]|nr:NAD-dependent epimerase/dehydratase family protein [Patescibacteria group bacterium]